MSALLWKWRWCYAVVKSLLFGPLSPVRTGQDVSAKTGIVEPNRDLLESDAQRSMWCRPIFSPWYESWVCDRLRLDRVLVEQKMSTPRHVHAVTSLWTNPRSEAGDVVENRNGMQDTEPNGPGDLVRLEGRCSRVYLKVFRLSSFSISTGIWISFLEDMHRIHT